MDCIGSIQRRESSASAVIGFLHLAVIRFLRLAFVGFLRHRFGFSFLHIAVVMRRDSASALIAVMRRRSVSFLHIAVIDSALALLR